MQKIYKKNLKSDNLPSEELYSDEDMKKIYSLIAENIKDERIKRNINIPKLENLSGIDRKSLYRIEKGNKKISFVYLIKICNVLGLNLDEVCPLPENKLEQELKELVQTLDSQERAKVAEYIRSMKKENGKKA